LILGNGAFHNLQPAHIDAIEKFVRVGG
jgi:hypothetical protein